VGGGVTVERPVQSVEAITRKARKARNLVLMVFRMPVKANHSATCNDIGRSPCDGGIPTVVEEGEELRKGRN
jgi:hypothetical protein